MKTKGTIPPKETWWYYHRKDKDSPIEIAKGDANVIFSSTPDTRKMGLGAEIADLSGSNFIQSKVDFHTREMVRRWDVFEEGGLVGEMETALKRSPAPNIFAQFADFAEECMTKPSMAVYKGHFSGLAIFLRSCEGRAEESLAILARTAKEGVG